jgi:hypothetical protein
MQCLYTPSQSLEGDQIRSLVFGALQHEQGRAATRRQRVDGRAANQEPGVHDAHARPRLSRSGLAKLGVHRQCDVGTVYAKGRRPRSHFSQRLGAGVWFVATVTRLNLVVAQASAPARLGCRVCWRSRSCSRRTTTRLEGNSGGPGSATCRAMRRSATWQTANSRDDRRQWRRAGRHVPGSRSRDPESSRSRGGHWSVRSARPLRSTHGSTFS